jgi:Ca2+-binding RTX toxin-like protein
LAGGGWYSEGSQPSNRLGRIVEFSDNVTINNPAVIATDANFSQGRTLYADASQITDADGVGAIGWQWQRSTDNGSHWDDITDASFTSYTLSQADVGGLVRLQASYTDGGGTSEVVNSSASPEVINVNDAPVISSNGGGAIAAISIAENATAVTAVTATDVDPGTTLSYSISGGADAGLFQIDTNTGALSFKLAPNFETPADAGHDNIYDVIVEASDGTLSDSQAIAVTVTNVNEAPVISSDGGGSSATLVVDEKVALGTQIVATDPDSNTTITYSIAGGADAARFEIDPVTGQLAFITAPNIEAPADEGRDNIYDVLVQASDGTGIDALSDTQALSIEVWRIINGTPKVDRITGTTGGDYIFGLAGNDVLTGLAGDDLLDGGTGVDRMTGGTGNDTYVVDTVLDRVTEVAGEGTDTVQTGNTEYKLADTLENLTFTTGVAHFGTGNAAANTLIGNSGADKLLALDGNDVLQGLGGNDQLFGGAGNDQLDGGEGVDKLIGGAGDDVYFVDNASDIATEGGNKGNDTVFASVSYKLGSYVETLILTGSDAINGTGGSKANTIQGNGAANVLNGGADNDVLAGGLGNDTLIGGKGADKFLFDSLPGAGNIDLVSDFLRTQGDGIQLSKADFAGLGAIGTTLGSAAFFASATATAANDADDRIVYNTTSGALY